jgi:uncharacterized C2H2 Zn-finger protein
MSGSPNQTRDVSVAGSCPNCGQRIPATDVLIEYETSAGRSERFADCPRCEDVVHPD